MTDQGALTPDGYEMCPACGHHASACLGGRCTVLIPQPPDAEMMALPCDCDCYKVLHGISLWEHI